MSHQVQRFVEAADAAVAAPLLHKGEAAIKALQALGAVLADVEQRLGAVERKLAQLGEPPPAA